VGGERSVVVRGGQRNWRLCGTVPVRWGAHRRNGNSRFGLDPADFHVDGSGGSLDVGFLQCTIARLMAPRGAQRPPGQLATAVVRPQLAIHYLILVDRVARPGATKRLPVLVGSSSSLEHRDAERVSREGSVASNSW